MTLIEIRDVVRTTFADTVGNANTKLWSDSELNGYINRVVNTICRECRILVDTTSSYL